MLRNTDTIRLETTVLVAWMKDKLVSCLQGELSAVDIHWGTHVLNRSPWPNWVILNILWLMTTLQFNCDDATSRSTDPMLIGRDAAVDGGSARPMQAAM